MEEAVNGKIYNLLAILYTRKDLYIWIIFHLFSSEFDFTADKHQIFAFNLDKGNIFSMYNHVDCVNKALLQIQFRLKHEW